MGGMGVPEQVRDCHYLAPFTFDRGWEEELGRLPYPPKLILRCPPMGKDIPILSNLL
jgi:hypothetical protein